MISLPMTFISFLFQIIRKCFNAALIAFSFSGGHVGILALSDFARL